MSLTRPAVLVLIACLALTRSSFAAETDKVEFVPVTGFPQIPSGLTLGKCSAVALDSHAQIFVLHRGPTPVLVFDADGKFLRGWGDEYLQTPHGLRIDRDDNVWITDIGNHLVLKFDPRGKLLLALGKSGQPGPELDQFNKPSDIAFGAGDRVFISDGYINTRVMQFDQRGKFVKTWGRPGSGPGEFNLVHAIKIDRRQRVLVGDRENERIQVFDQDGKLLTMWKGFAPYGIDIDRDGRIFVADTTANQILQLDGDGQVVHTWGSEGTEPGRFRAPHMLACGPAGELYVAEVDGRRLQTFRRK